MKEWNDIVNIALLGTGKKSMFSAENALLNKAIAFIQQHPKLDNEERFLQQACLVYNFRQAGFAPLLKEQVPFTEAPGETLPYCSAQEHSCLNEVLSFGNQKLLMLWLQCCNSVNKIVNPEYIPKLLSIAKESKSLLPYIIPSVGERGKWIMKFNEDWNALTTLGADTTIWKTGNALQRKTLLIKKRKTEPAAAIDLLKSTWEQEDAATKTQFLETFFYNTSEADIEFLQSIESDRSKKVKELSIELQKLIPNSNIVLSYIEILKVAIRYKSFITSSIDFKLPEIPPIIFKTGIDKLSSTPTISDHDHVLIQLISQVPPDFWEKELKLDIDTILELFSKHIIHTELVKALAMATARFRNKEWALSFTKLKSAFFIELAAVLNKEDAENYCVKFFNGYQDEILNYYISVEEEWGKNIAEKLLQYISRNPVSFNKEIFTNHIHLFPLSIQSSLDQLVPEAPEKLHYWLILKETLKDLLNLKTKIITAFNK